jgi:tetratricopeptide (TPR) repeat protein
MNDVFAIQDEISQAIFEKLKLRLAIEKDQPLVKRCTENLEAYDLYLRGRYYAHRYTMEGLSNARECYERALALDPDYALAYVGLSFSYGASGWFGLISPREASEIGQKFTLRALDIDPGLVEAHCQMGIYCGTYELDWAKAEEEFKRATAINPASLEIADTFPIHFLIPNGRLEEALALVQSALERDPLSYQFHVYLGWVLLMLREYDRSLEAYRRAMDIERSNYLSYWGFGLVYILTGRIEKGIPMLEKARDLSGGIAVTVGSLGCAYALSGRKDEGRGLLEELLKAAEQRYVSPVSIAYIYLGLGETAKAFEWLDKAADSRDGPIFTIKAHPLYDVLRQDPRYHALLRKLRLE